MKTSMEVGQTNINNFSWTDFEEQINFKKLIFYMIRVGPSAVRLYEIDSSFR